MAEWNSLTHQRLLELLHYDPLTGIFIWLQKPSRGVNAGDIAGTCVNEYNKIQIRGVKYQSNRLAWFYMTGKWPANKVDHIDGVHSNDKWLNLRDVTQRVNMQNQRKARSDNATGLLGAQRSGRRFLALINVNGVRVKLGVFDSAQQAHEAYIHAKRELHPGCTI